MGSRKRGAADNQGLTNRGTLYRIKVIHLHRVTQATRELLIACNVPATVLTLPYNPFYFVLSSLYVSVKLQLPK